MRTRFLQFLLAMALCVVLAPMTASARGNGKDKDKDSDRHADRDHDRDKDKDRDKVKDRDKDKDRARPAGWSKGRKTGWGNCNLPPGQAKKNGGCNNVRRDRDDRRVAAAKPRVHPANTVTRGPDGRLIVHRNDLRKPDAK